MNLEKHFGNIGAQLEVRRVPRIGFRDVRNFDINVQGKGRNEHFVIRVTPQAPEFQVLQSNKAARHLLLMARNDVRPGTRPDTERFLCGHDERHWFAASVNGAVSTITDARRSLLPQGFDKSGFTPDELAQRHGPRFKRQGEWFFVPADVDQIARLKGKTVHRSEPITRPGGGKPHLVSELIRFGGENVVVAGSSEYSIAAWNAMDDDKKKIRHRFMVKDPEVYVRGPIRHPDHATLILPDWHRVFVNGEIRSGSLSFYD